MLPLSAAVYVRAVNLNDSLSQKSSRRRRSRRCLTVVNRRQKGVFASSQNKAKQVKKILEERFSAWPQRLKVLGKSSQRKDGDFEEVPGGLWRTLMRIVNSVVAGA